MKDKRKYKGFDIIVESYKGDFDDYKWSAECPQLNSVHTSTNAKESISKVEEDIDYFIEHEPQTKEEWADYIYKNCVVWDGHDQCHIDPKSIWISLNKFKDINKS